MSVVSSWRQLVDPVVPLDLPEGHLAQALPFLSFSVFFEYPLPLSYTPLDLTLHGCFILNIVIDITTSKCMKLVIHLYL
jgi:hypothetical protein